MGAEIAAFVMGAAIAEVLRWGITKFKQDKTPTPPKA